MATSDPEENAHGLWTTATDVGDAETLLRALDPAAPYVLIVGGIHHHFEWQEEVVSFGPGDTARPRFVRSTSFQALIGVDEAAEIGAAHRQSADGGLECYQFTQQPKASFHIPEGGRARAAAFRGQAVHLAIDLPHDGEVALISSPSVEALSSFADRLRVIGG